MISFFLIGAVVYGGYLYYKKQEDIKKVNDKDKTLKIKIAQIESDIEKLNYSNVKQNIPLNKKV